MTNYEYKEEAQVVATAIVRMLCSLLSGEDSQLDINELAAKTPPVLQGIFAGILWLRWGKPQVERETIHKRKSNAFLLNVRSEHQDHCIDASGRSWIIMKGHDDANREATWNAIPWSSHRGSSAKWGFLRRWVPWHALRSYPLIGWAEKYFSRSMKIGRIAQ